MCGEGRERRGALKVYSTHTSRKKRLSNIIDHATTVPRTDKRHPALCVTLAHAPHAARTGSNSMRLPHAARVYGVARKPGHAVARAAVHERATRLVAIGSGARPAIVVSGCTVS